MHPLLTRIHPALRTALVAWLFSRLTLWLMWPIRPDVLGHGQPLPGLLQSLIHQLSDAITSAVASTAVEALPWIALELGLLYAGVCVYRFARTTELPQIAERATWIWMWSPLLALHAADWSGQMAIILATIALASLVSRRPRLAIVAAFFALGCRLELMILWPAFLIAAIAEHNKGKRSTQMEMIAQVAVIPLAFAAWIAASWHLAGQAQTSLRDLHGDTLWRTSEHLLVAGPIDQLLVAAGLALLFLTLRYFRRLPSWYALAALPLLVLPLAQVPAYPLALLWGAGLPLVVYLALATDDRRVERPLMAALVIAFILAIPT